jgi:hypothetical protein
MSPADLDRLHFGRTTPAEVEHVFGAPDTHTPDGSLVYQNRRIGDRSRVDETVTFRFRGDRLAKICRTRS